MKLTKCKVCGNDMYSSYNAVTCSNECKMARQQYYENNAKRKRILKNLCYNEPTGLYYNVKTNLIIK